MSMSPYRITGPDHGLRIRREVPAIVNGVKEGSTYIDLYDKISGRVGDLENGQDNELNMPEKEGEHKENARVVILTPQFPLNKATSGDFLVIPWGTKPNFWVPPTVPNGLGPAIVIDTPLGRKLLEWDGTQYYESTVTIFKSGGNWCISSDPQYCFSTANFYLEAFPEGYSFVRATGPLAYFKILRMNASRDDMGRISHYTCLVEYRDQRGHVVQG